MSLSLGANGSPDRAPQNPERTNGFALVSFENLKNALRGGIVRTVRHDPVMIEEILEVLPLHPGATVVDGTLGLGGHSLRFLERIRPGGTLVGLDWDEQMLSEAIKRIGHPEGAEILLLHRDFREIGAVMEEAEKKADGILLDLGLNSAQVDDPARGFSFQTPGPLDMRMDRTRGEPASALLNRLSVHEISDLLRDYGDERWSLAIARKILERRKETPLRTTQDLVECVLAAIPPGARDKRIHPATRTFQAIRIAANGELDGLEEALIEAADCLKPGGVLAVLSYHSGEDRIVKHTFRDLVEEGFEEVTRKPRVANQEETLRNPRSRSAKLRALIRHKPLQN
jgi:16S rRNA (cytosine1402-N4)-methyltransferase